MSDIAEWAMQKAREIVAKRFEEENHKLHMAILRGDMDDVMPKIKAIYSALMAADKAATERERERFRAIVQAAYKPAQSRDTNVMMQDCAVNEVLAELEAAIRKGTHNV